MGPHGYSSTNPCGHRARCASCLCQFPSHYPRYPRWYTSPDSPAAALFALNLGVDEAISEIGDILSSSVTRLLDEASLSPTGKSKKMTRSNEIGHELLNKRKNVERGFEITPFRSIYPAGHILAEGHVAHVSESLEYLVATILTPRECFSFFCRTMSFAEWPSTVRRTSSTCPEICHEPSLTPLEQISTHLAPGWRPGTRREHEYDAEYGIFHLATTRIVLPLEPGPSTLPTSDWVRSAAR